MQGALSAFRTYLGLGPKELPKALPIDLPFSLTIARVEFDTAMNQEDARFTTLQSIWIDNALNSDPLVITLNGGSQQIIRCPSFSQGVFPLIANGNQKFIAQTTAKNIVIPVILLNVPQPYFVYSVS